MGSWGITHDRKKTDYWVPYNKYKANAKVDTTIPIHRNLQEVHNLVLSVNYNPAKQQRIPYLKYHEIKMRSASLIKRAKGCPIGKGCNQACGCKTKGLRHHSGCMCDGNCA